MAPTPPNSNRKRKTTRVIYRAGKSRKLFSTDHARKTSKSSIGDRFKHVSNLRRIRDGGSKPKDASNRKKVTDESAYDPRTPAVKRFKSKGMRFKVAKTAHASKRFKALVGDALKKDEVHGSHRVTYIGGGLGGGYSNAQYVTLGPGAPTGYGQGTAPSPYLFTPEYFCNAVGVLFNGKTNAATVAGSLMNSAGNFPYTTVKFLVKNCWTKFNIKNNFNRNVMLKIYLCRPKRKSAYLWNWSYSGTNPAANDSADFGYQLLNTNANSATPSFDAIAPPDVCWTKGLGVDGAMGINLSGANLETLHMDPKRTPGFAKQWACELTDIVLAPGQSYDYFVNGPSNLEYSAENMFTNGVFMNLQKYVRAPMFVWNLDQAATTLGTNGRWVELTGTGQLCIERQDFCRVKMPEQTGLVLPVIGSYVSGSTVLGQRAHRYYVNQYVNGAQAGVIEDVLEMATTVAA